MQQQRAPKLARNLSKVRLMKNLILGIVGLVILITTTAAKPDILDDIALAIRSGEARSVARFFGNSVDLTISNQEDVYSKTQAERILLDFFAKNPPRSFQINHKGESKEGAQYAIGSLVTNSGTNFRTYFYIKTQGNTQVIQELRFMKE